LLTSELLADTYRIYCQLIPKANVTVALTLNITLILTLTVALILSLTLKADCTIAV